MFVSTALSNSGTLVSTWCHFVVTSMIGSCDQVLTVSYISLFFVLLPRMVQFRSGANVIVGPTILPAGLAPSTVPPGVKQLQANTTVPEDDQRSKEYIVAQPVAKAAEYELKVKILHVYFLSTRILVLVCLNAGHPACHKNIKIHSSNVLALY